MARRMNRNVPVRCRVGEKAEAQRLSLTYDHASKVHEDWCNQELFGFFWRLQDTLKKSETPGLALGAACYKGEQKRNEIVLDIPYMQSYDTTFKNVVNNGDFDQFKSQFVDRGNIEVMRFAKRSLTDEEIRKAGNNYRNGEENILRPFKELSADSKKENLEAAIGACNVYEEMCKAGVSIEEMEVNTEIRNMIGIAIHADWLKRNMNHPNESLKVPYAELDSWTQQQDLTVFGALLDVVKKNKNLYFINKEEGFVLPDYEAEERKILGLPTKQK